MNKEEAICAYSFTVDGLEHLAIQAARLMLNELYKDKLITEEKMIEYTDSVWIHVRSREWWKEVFPKYAEQLPDDDDRLYMRICRLGEGRNENNDNG